MQKFLFVTILCLIAVCGLQAQPDKVVLEDRYGAIRADMVRQVCAYAGITDSSLLNKINNKSLKVFSRNLKNDTVRKIVSVAKQLMGTDISRYDRDLRDTQKAIQDKLCEYYPDRKTEIEQTFNSYTGKIDALTKELRNPDVSSSKESPSAQPTKPDSGEKKAKPKKPVKDEGNGKGSFIVWLAILLALMLIVAFLFKKIRRIIIAMKKKRPRLGHNRERIIPDDAREKDVPAHVDESTNGKALELQKEGEILIPEPSQDATKDNQVEAPIPESDKGPILSPLLEQPGLQENLDETFVLPPEKGKCTAMDAGNWIVVGASVQGNGHVKMGVPCQDNHAYEYLSDGWGIAISSDGAGSASLSHKGSAAVVSRAMAHFKELIARQGWKEKDVLPTDMEWMKLSYKTLKQVHDDIAALAKRLECPPKELSATVIIIVHSPKGLLVAHVGDGRAGYKDMDGNWHALITPHKGEEANQTIFMQSGFWNIPFYEMSGVTVPESRVLAEPVAAFTLMSDGCESTSWLCNQYNEETSKYYDPNIPYAKFFDSLIETLQSFRDENVSMAERSKKWYGFINNGIKAFIKETDDKTMILATCYKKKE